MPATVDALIAVLRKFAQRHPGVEETIACNGTAVESASFKVGSKAVLFSRPAAALVKLEQSLGAAKRLTQHPSCP